MCLKWGGVRMDIEPITAANRREVNDFLRGQWGTTDMAVRGRVFDLTALDGLLARAGGAIAGLVTWRLDGDACEVMSLDSRRENAGIGTALLQAAETRARALSCRRLVLITTNDNLRALRFYQRRGFALKALYPDAVAAARRLKPEIPLRSADGIPIRDEIELEKPL